MPSDETDRLPRFPAWPQEEYLERHRRARAAMERAGIDLLLLSARENVEYFSGYLSSHWFMVGFVPGVILFPRVGEPCLIVPNFWKGTAASKSWIRDIIPHPGTHSHPETFPDLVVDEIVRRGWSKSTIGYEQGFEMTVGLPIQHWDRVRGSLGGARWLPAGPLLWSLRTFKSPLEVELLAQAGAATCRVLSRLRGELRIGMTETEIGKRIRRAQAEEGCEDRQFLNLRCGPDRYGMTDTLPENRPIGEGEMLILDVGMHRQDYWSDLARCVSVGAPSAEQKAVYQTIVEAEKAGLEVIRAGVPASAIYHAVREVIDRAGYGVHVDMVGHGIGMGMYEPPMLSPAASDILQEGMVLCLEPWITLPEGRGVFCLEDMVAVKESGCVQLTPRDADELWSCR